MADINRSALYNQEKLKDWALRFADAFNLQHWEDEKFKWIAVKHFQDNWDIDAPDFASMLDKALGKTENLLTSFNSFPKGMIVQYAKWNSERVHDLFEELFDENLDVILRIEQFKGAIKQLHSEYQQYDPGAKNHYQDENTITTYLWLRYPDKYYIYKIGEVRKTAQAIGSQLVFKNGKYEANLTNFFELYNAICEKLKNDEALVKRFRGYLEKDCYPDPELKTLTIDFGYFVSSELKNAAASKINPKTGQYDPGLTISEWVELLENSEVFDWDSMILMSRIKNEGGNASCSQLSHKYGETINWYNNKSQALGKRVMSAAGLEQIEYKEGGNIFWRYLYSGHDADSSTPGVWVWSLHENLSKALDRIDLSRYPIYPELNESQANCWWLNASPRIWSYADTPVGEEQSYTLLNENGNKRRIYQHFLDAKPGDIVIGYETNPVKQIVALGKITAGSDGEKISFVKTEALANPIDYNTLRENPDLEEMEFFVNPNGSLFKVTSEEQAVIMDIIREQNPLPEKGAHRAYTKDDFLGDVFMSAEAYDNLANALAKKKNIILQGAPGTGKTFAAKRLAHSIMGEKNDDRIEFVQFHQNYSYEDFVMGYKPVGDGFELKRGIFYRFCKKAESSGDSGEPYFFIIDEINRGNMSKIFGELLMLIESSHRGEQATLAYDGMRFSVPENLYIIGMMNTADRSLAMIDYALRRRFAFFEMAPALESEGFREEIAGHGSPKLEALVSVVSELNDAIAADRSLGKGFRIGHSYFCDLEDATDDALRSIVDFEIMPMLEEYWFDDENKVDAWRRRLEDAIK